MKKKTEERAEPEIDWEVEPDFNDPEGYVDDIDDEGKTGHLFLSFSA